MLGTTQLNQGVLFNDATRKAGFQHSCFDHGPQLHLFFRLRCQRLRLEFELAFRGDDFDAGVVGDVALEERAGEFRFEFALDDPLERARAINGIVAAPGEEFLRRFAQFEFDVAFGEAQAKLTPDVMKRVDEIVGI